MFKKVWNLQMFIVLGVIVLATVIICFCAASCSGEKLTFEEPYYFVCYRTSDNAVSAGSLSDTASSYGGAGYILSYDENFYVTLSCYYKDDEAAAVCSNLKKHDLECSVLKIETKEYKLSSRSNKELYLGNLNTLNSLSALAYDCANGLDTQSLSQSKAKQILTSITDTLKGLLKSNKSNCFTEPIQSALEECEKFGGGYLLSKNMRYIQIALADRIINAKLD